MENNDNERIEEFPADNKIVYPEEPDSPDENPNKDKVAEDIIRLKDSLTAEKIKVALLIAGVTAEKLDEASAMVRGLYDSGKSIEDTVEDVVGAYPHLRAVKREIPQFAAASFGGNDGFSAIRRIFSGK
ncbi:MAG: hypothetical protein K2N06_07945 [Oscillospiraceae bacterium]|nr:hypothetical protein [Oscillospiraceae bacterium]